MSVGWRTALPAAGWMVAMLAAAALLGAAPAAASTTGLVRVGRVPAAVPSPVERTMVAPTLRLHVTVTLQPRNPAALVAYASGVATPGSPDYHRYLTPARFAARFGARPGAISLVRRALQARGLRPSAVSAGGLSISVAASAGQLERAFSVSLRQIALPGRRAEIETDRRPAVAASAAPAIQSVLGLDTADSPQPLLLRPARRAAGGRAGHVEAPRATAHAASAGPQPCTEAQEAANGPDGQGAHTDNQLASAYDFDGLYAAGDEGAGVTVAVYELESDDPSDIAAYQSCYGTHATVSYIPVDGGAGSGPGQGEAALDIENLIGFAPDVHVLVYQGPNSDSGAPGSGPYDTFRAIIDGDQAQVVSVSWGECEQIVGQAVALAENTLFEQAAVQGQTIVSADGDSGAQDCDDPDAATPDTETAVDDPSSQPFVTGVGGTTLSALGPRPTETVWNTGGEPLSGDMEAGASGGGVSSFWPMPAAQADAAASLGVRGAALGALPCASPSGACREVPDVAADADPATGYLIYWNGRGEVPDQPQGWQGIGGTSATAPLWAALMALADGSSACAGSPVGYADPALYRAAGQDYAADFNDITTGNNDFTGTNGGQYAARDGYDAATGLGTPNAAPLAAALCADTVRLDAPGSERSTVHAAVTVRLRSADAPGTSVTYSATGLPPGVKLGSATGVISGHPTRTGSFTVRVSAHDSAQSQASRSFVWTVGAAPRVTGLSLVPARGGADVALTVAAGRNAPDLQSIAVTLPTGLRLTSARRGVSVKTTARHPRSLSFSRHVTGSRTITITLRRATASIRIALAPPLLRESGGRIPRAARTGGRLALSVTVLDASAGDTRLTARVVARR